MSKYIKQPERTIGTPFLHNIVFALLALVMLVVFLKPDYSNVCGPVLIVMFLFLYLAGYYEFVFAVIITANDALGTMFLGKVSFQYLLLALAVLKLLQTMSISKRRVAFFLTALYLLLQLLWVDTLPPRMFLVALSYVLAVFAMMLDTNEQALALFFKGVAFTVVVIAIHAMLTGGVEYYKALDITMSNENEHLLRRGVLGAGNGNPNHSAFLLNIGLIALWSFTSLKLPLKLICSIPILYAFVLTSSMSGLLSLILIITLSVLLQQDRNSKQSKRAFTICVIILVLIGVYVVYTSLPNDMRFSALDNYLDRIEAKLDFAQSGNWDTVTTNRSHLATKYLYYIFSRQSVLGLFFGGNPLVVPSVSSAIAHNNYLGLLLQIGLIGTVIFLIAVIKRFLSVWQDSNIPFRKGRLLLKCFCLFASFGISLYGSSLWTFWMLILLLI